MVSFAVSAQSTPILIYENNNIPAAPLSVRNQIDKIQIGNYYTFHGFFHVSDLSSVQNNGKVLLTLHHDSLADTNYVFSAKDVNYSDTSYYWYGEQTVGPDLLAASFLHIMKESDSNYIFSFSLNGYAFKGVSLDGGYFGLFEYIEKDASCGVDSTSVSDTTTSTVDYVSMKNCPGNCQIDILFLYTSGALNKLSKPEYIESEISSAIFQTRTIFKNSGISDCVARINVVGKELVSFPLSNHTDEFYLTNSPTANALEHLINDFASLRDINHEDIVFLIDGDELMSFGANGIATTLMEPSRMFSIVSISALNNARYTFSHELAHLLTARHDKENDPDGANLTDYNGYLWKSNGWWHYTVMGVPGQRWPNGNLKSNQSRIPYYSNPYIKYFDGNNLKVTGTTVDATAFAFINNSCVVSGMKTDPSPPTFNAYINGDYFACPCMPVAFDVSISGGPTGQGIYSYQWYSSTDGINYTFLGNYLNQSIQASCIEGDVVFVKVVVSVGAISRTSIVPLKTSLAPYGLPCTLKTGVENINDPENSDYVLSVFPNPANDFITVINTKSFEQGDVLVLYNANGQRINRKTVSKKGTSFQFDISALPAGLYVVKSLNNPSSFVSFVKTK